MVGIRKKKGESDEDKQIRIDDIDKRLDDHEGFHKMVIYYKGVPRMIPTDGKGKFLPYRDLKKKTVYECFEMYTLEELKELIRAGFVKVEELS